MNEHITSIYNCVSDRDNTVARLFIEGLTMKEIVPKVGVSKRSVWRSWRRWRKADAEANQRGR